MSIEDMADSLYDAAIWTDQLQREQFLQSIKNKSYQFIYDAEQQEKRICLLADAIGEIAIAMGIIERGVETTGPQVLLIAHDCMMAANDLSGE